MIMKKPGKPVENDWMTTEEKPEKPSKPGWKKYQRFGRYGWLLKTSQSCSAKNQRKNSPFGKKPLDKKKTTGYDQKHAKRTGSYHHEGKFFFNLFDLV